MSPSTTNPPPTTPALDLALEQFAETIGPLPESPLTEFEQSLLCDLTALVPNETAKFAEQVGLTELQLALWLQKPHIAQAHQTLREFRAQRRKSWQEEVTRDVVENLRDLMKTAEDPVERRRTASAILRAFNRPSRARRTQATAGAAPTQGYLATRAGALPDARPARTWTLRPEDISRPNPKPAQQPLPNPESQIPNPGLLHEQPPPNPEPHQRPAPTPDPSSVALGDPPCFNSDSEPSPDAPAAESPTPEPPQQPSPGPEEPQATRAQQHRSQHNAETQNLNPRDRVGADRNQPASHRPRSSASPRDPRGPAPGHSRQASARPPPLPL